MSAKALRVERAWTLAEGAMGHLWLELTVKREGGSKRGQVSVVREG